MTQQMIRRSNTSALVNTDINEYRAAKARSKQDSYLKSLENRINRLEDTITELSEILAQCKRDD